MFKREITEKLFPVKSLWGKTLFTPHWADFSLKKMVKWRIKKDESSSFPINTNATYFELSCDKYHVCINMTNLSFKYTYIILCIASLDAYSHYVHDYAYTLDFNIHILTYLYN